MLELKLLEGTFSRSIRVNIEMKGEGGHFFWASLTNIEMGEGGNILLFHLGQH